MNKHRIQSQEPAGESGDWPSVMSEVVPMFAITRFFIFIVAYGGYHFIGGELPSDNFLWHGIVPDSNAFLRIWQRWDSIHYLSILKNGYSHFTPEAMNTAFFPLYPMLGYVVNLLLRMPTFSLLLVSNVAFFFALTFLVRLVRLDHGDDVAKRTAFYVAIFPFSFFFAGMYTESLFLLTLAATMYYARKGEWVKAGIWGILLTSTRLVGVAGVLAAGIEYMHQRGWDFRKLDRYALAIVAMPLGLLGYMLYTHLAFGDFFSLFESSQKGWNRQIAWPWVSFQEHITRIQLGTAFPIFIYNVIFSFLALALSMMNFRYLRWSYAILALALVLIPFSSNSLNAIPRYLIIVIPNFILLGILGGKKSLDLFITTGSLIFLGCLTVLYANWVYVG
ncbi:MAG: hypothetical protein HYW57_03270 [Ignavibacteriales bacterium]|nr:hypothetical protein [Ignavibacteriales bacterium]